MGTTGREIWGQSKKYFVVSGVVLQRRELPGTALTTKLHSWTRGLVSVHQGGEEA